MGKAGSRIMPYLLLLIMLILGSVFILNRISGLDPETAGGTWALSLNGKLVILKNNGTWLPNPISKWIAESKAKKIIESEKLEKTRLLQSEIENSRCLVMELSGEVQTKEGDGWKNVVAGQGYAGECEFRTGADATLVLEVFRNNLVKLSPDTFFRINPPAIDSSNGILQTGMLEYGECTAFISVDGRDTLDIRSKEVSVFGLLGTFKMITDKTAASGEVIVKNGLVEVASGKMDKKKKVSGFYKVAFKEGIVSDPVQASIIQYDWR